MNDIPKRQALGQPLESCNLGWFLPTGFNGVLWSEACRARLVEPKPVFPTASQKIPTALWVVPGVLENQQQGIFRVWFQLAIFFGLLSFGCLGEKNNFCLQVVLSVFYRGWMWLCCFAMLCLPFSIPSNTPHLVVWRCAISTSLAAVISASRNPNYEKPSTSISGHSSPASAVVATKHQKLVVSLWRIFKLKAKICKDDVIFTWQLWAQVASTCPVSSMNA